MGFARAMVVATLVAVAPSACRRGDEGGGEGVATQPARPEPTNRSPEAGSEKTEEAAVVSTGSGSVEGTVRFVGERIPTSTIVPVGADPQYCGHQHSKEDWVVDPRSRGIRYVIVHISGNGLKRWPSKPGHLLLDNKECRFEPHAAVLTVGSTLEVKNSDKILHTAHAYFGATFNLALPAEGTPVKRVLRRPGMIQIRCDKHGWMNAFIRVDDHPFHAVTDSQGRFKIAGVPPGSYTLEAWHERSGSKKQEISVTDRQTTRVDLTMME